MKRFSLFALLLAACITPPQPAPTKLQFAQTQAQPPAPLLPSARLRALADRYWLALLETTALPSLGDGGLGGPLYATALGDHRFDARLDDLSPAARVRVSKTLAQLRQELDAVPPAGLGTEDAITLQILRSQLDDARASEICTGEVWLVDQMNGAQQQLPQIASFYALGTARGAADLAARFAQGGHYFDQLIANLQNGLIQKKTSPQGNVRAVIGQLDRLLAAPALLVPAEEKFAGLPEEGRGPARAAIQRALDDQLLPGLRRYREFLQTTLLPQARSEVGLWAQPGGEACYSFLVRYHTGSLLNPVELHQLGQTELAKIEAEQEEIAKAQGAKPGRDGHVDLKAFLASLGRRKDQFKSSGEELLAWNKATLARAEAAIPRAFSQGAPRPIETRPIEEYRAANQVPAYYQPATDDNSQPAIYYVNLDKPETRALYNEEALCFHETVPGHHLQTSIAQELKDLPDFRRQTGQTAYAEGWALYCERMADETLHLYSGPLARYGMLGYQAWRASRLVVDTGMHALKWDRAQALTFLRDHTTLTPDEAANEIDRYVIMPGQALAYLVGELELFRLRHEAEKKLGSRFELKQFHDVVLNHGAVPLTILGKLLADWESEQLKQH